MKSKSQLIREFFNNLGINFREMKTQGSQFFAITDEEIIMGHVTGDNVILDQRWEK